MVKHLPLLTAAGLLPAAVLAQERPNIVLIMADDMGYSDLGCMGSEINTPNLDSLAANGVLMTNFCNTSKSCPSRASLLTGLYSWRAGMGDMTNTHSLYPEYQGWLNENCVTIAEVLGESGYSTYISGKWHVGDDKQYWPERRGFNQTFHIPNGGGIYFYPSKFPQRANRKLYRNDVEQFPEEGWYATDGFGDVAVEYICRQENQQKPFFLYVPFTAPHYPLQAKQEDIAKYQGVYDAGYAAIRAQRFRRQRELGVLEGEFELSEATHPDWESVADKPREASRMAAYAAQIDCIDQNVGKIVKALKEKGLYDNTVIIFLSDNGAVMNHFDDTPDVPYGSEYCWASIGKWQNVSNTPFREGKGREYEGGIKTPLIFHWPAGLGKTGVKVRDYAHITDIMPTCIELAGAKYPKEFHGHRILSCDGYSLIPLLRGRHVRQNRVLFFDHEGWSGLRKGRWKIDRRKGSTDWELYDLKNDPYENVNLAGKHPRRLKRLASKWEKMAAQMGVRPWPLDN